jgi:hypothetical protein
MVVAKYRPTTTQCKAHSIEAHEHKEFSAAIHMCHVFESFVRAHSAARLLLSDSNHDVATEGCSPIGESMLVLAVHVLLSS